MAIYFNFLELTIDNYGISVTTLEEVFMKVEEGHAMSIEHKIEIKEKADHKLDIESQEPEIEKQWSILMDQIRDRSMNSLFLIHLKAVLLKKFYSTKRDSKVNDT